MLGGPLTKILKVCNPSFLPTTRYDLTALGPVPNLRFLEPRAGPRR